MAIRAALVGSVGVLSTVLAVAGGCTAVSGLNKDYTFESDAGGGGAVDASPTADAAADASDGSSLIDAGHHEVCTDKSLSIANGECTRCAQTRCCSQLQAACSTSQGCGDFLRCFDACPAGDRPSTTGLPTICVTECINKAAISGQRQPFHDLGVCIGASAPSDGCAAACDYR